MLKYLLIFAFTLNIFAWKSMRRLHFVNKCPQTLWIGAFAVPQPSKTGWEMKSGATFDISIPANTVAARFWARTDCNWVNGKFVCLTGDCGTPSNNFGIECKGITGKAPATLA